MKNIKLLVFFLWNFTALYSVTFTSDRITFFWFGSNINENQNIYTLIKNLQNDILFVYKFEFIYRTRVNKKCPDSDSHPVIMDRKIRDNVMLIRRKQLTDYFDIDLIPVSFGGKRERINDILKEYSPLH